MSPLASRILAFGLFVMVWMVLVPPSANGQIVFAPPRGANAISPTMSTMDRPATATAQPRTNRTRTERAPSAQAPVTRYRAEQAQEAETVADLSLERNQGDTTIQAVSAHPHARDSQQPRDSQPHSTSAASPSYSVVVSPSYLRLLNVRDEDPSASARPAAIRSTHRVPASRADAPSQPAAPDRVHLSSYRIGTQL